MAVKYVQRRLNGGGRSFEEVEPPPESLEVSKSLSSVQQFIKIRGCSFPEAPGSWTSFISGEMVPGHTRQEWFAAFTYHVHEVMASSSKGVSFPSTIHISPIPSPDLSKINNLNDDEGFQTPNRAIVAVEPASSDSQQRKRRRRKLDLVVSDSQEKRPDWLPSDWQVEYRRREGGATAGLTDRYYYEPGSRRQFRSKKEVLCFLETGTRRKYKAKAQEKSNSGVNVTPSEPTGSSLEKRKRNTLNYDFDCPPKKVTWILNSFPEAPGEWTSFISGEMVPGHSRQEWDAAFKYHVHGVLASSSKVDDVEVNLEAEA